jgi:lysyl-tRNA synthetase class 1
MVLRTDLEKSNNIQTDLIPDLVDIYETFERTYYGLDDVDSEKQEFARILYPNTEVRPVSDQYIPKLSFKFALVTSQLQGILGEEIILSRCYDVLKKQHNLTEISSEAKMLIPKRLSRALAWVKEYGSEQDIVNVPDNVPVDIISTLTDTDRLFLSKLVEILEKDVLDEDGIQSAIFNTAREAAIKPKRAFQVLYRILISRKSGPRLGPFLLMLGNDWVLERIKSVL